MVVLFVAKYCSSFHAYSSCTVIVLHGGIIRVSHKACSRQQRSTSGGCKNNVLPRVLQALRMGLLDDLLTSKTDPVSAANADVLVSYETRIKNINALEDTIEDLSDDELRWQSQ